MHTKVISAHKIFLEIFTPFHQDLIFIYSGFLLLTSLTNEINQHQIEFKGRIVRKAINAEVKMESSWRDREGEPTRPDKRRSGGGPNNARCLLRDADRSSGLKFFEMA
ncbi:hypothetical protein Peur_022295 [Populus x canadensis]